MKNLITLTTALTRFLVLQWPFIVFIFLVRFIDILRVIKLIQPLILVFIIFLVFHFVKILQVLVSFRRVVFLDALYELVELEVLYIIGPNIAVVDSQAFQAAEEQSVVYNIPFVDFYFWTAIFIENFINFIDENLLFVWILKK